MYAHMYNLLDGLQCQSESPSLNKDVRFTSSIFSFIFRYPKYEFIYDQNISSSAALKSRYNELSLLGTIKDIYSLVQCEFVVCTFSSTVRPLRYFHILMLP